MAIKSTIRPGSVLVLCLLVPGCGASTGTVTGKVSYQGETLGGGTVVFYAPGKATVTASIGPDGTYTISNIPSGTVRIAVETKSAMPASFNSPVSAAAVMAKPLPPPDAIPPEARAMRPGGQQSGGKYVAIPADFGDLEKSNLSLKVTGGDQHFDIELK
jgi:hypothetical protein